MVMKTLLRGFCSLLVKFCLYGFAITAALAMVFGSSGPIKQTLKGSGAYDSFVDTVLQAAAKQDHPAVYSDPGIIAAAKKAFTPQVLETNADTVIDSVYSWLEGKTPEPTFKLDFSGAEEAFADNVTTYLVDRNSKLPICTPTQLLQLHLPIDLEQVINLKCQVPGIPTVLVRQQVHESLTGENGPLAHGAVFSSQDLPKDSQGQSVFKKAAFAPTIFKLLSWLPWALAGLVLLSGAGMIFLNDSRRRGLKALGIILIGTAVFIALSSFIFSLLFNKVNGPTGPLASADIGQLQKPVLNIVTTLMSQLNQKLYLMAGIYGVSGIGLLIGLHFTKVGPPQVKESVAINEPAEEVETTEPVEPPNN